MPIGRSTLALALAVLFAAAPTAAAPTGVRVEEARRGAVTLAETTSRVDPGATRLGDVLPLLREDAAAAIAAVDWTNLRLARRYGVAATVVRLSTERTDRAAASTCVVTAAVRELDTGNLLFVVEGRARAEDSPSAAARAERDALRAAVERAVAAVPEGLKRSR
jgi:hypothetical protein